MAQTAVGDLVVNLDVNSTKFNEQLSYVKKELKQTGNTANDEALRIQQSFSRQRTPRVRPVFQWVSITQRCVCSRRSLLTWPRSWRVGRTPG